MRNVLAEAKGGAVLAQPAWRLGEGQGPEGLDEGKRLLELTEKN